jgi:plastocyanin
MTLTRSLALTAALTLIALGAPATSTVSIIGSVGPGAFNPNPVTIASGDSVAWANNDLAIHRIVLDDGTYDSGDINPGSTSSATAALTASGAYHCIIHPSMTGTITVSAACTFSINPTSTSIPAAAATGTVTVTAGAGCAWTAVSNSSFITVTSGASGTGNGTVGYGVAANPSTLPRSGTVTIAGQTFTVNQAGAACAPIALSPSSLANATLGVPMSVTFTPSGGVAPHSFVVQTGSLPAGVTLSAAGVLSGTPTAIGTFPFTIRVSDSGGCFSDVGYSLVVLAPVPALPPMWMALLVVATIALASWSLTKRRLQGRSG